MSRLQPWWLTLDELDSLLSGVPSQAAPGGRGSQLPLGSEGPQLAWLATLTKPGQLSAQLGLTGPLSGGAGMAPQPE